MEVSNGHRPGSVGEHTLQERYGTFKRAAAFYDKQMLDHINPLMREYLARQEMVFISTSDAHGECDASFRAGPPGFVRVLDPYTVIYPDYKGNGVMASLGNMAENPHVGMLFVDFFHSGVGLHINGRAHIVEHRAVEAFLPKFLRSSGVEALWDVVPDKKKTPERWIVVQVVEAYVHCSKHIPILAHLPGDAGVAPGSGDFFKAKDDPRPWNETATPEPVACPVETFYETPAQVDELDTVLPPAWGADAPAVVQAPVAPAEDSVVVADVSVAAAGETTVVA
jgi:predicted pyridoxine 5'-phosphate oxidase superfamily flavin-nucleotide-binding protein